MREQIAMLKLKIQYISVNTSDDLSFTPNTGDIYEVLEVEKDNEGYLTKDIISFKTGLNLVKIKKN